MLMNRLPLQPHTFDFFALLHFVLLMIFLDFPLFTSYISSPSPPTPLIWFSRIFVVSLCWQLFTPPISNNVTSSSRPIFAFTVYIKFCSPLLPSNQPTIFRSLLTTNLLHTASQPSFARHFQYASIDFCWLPFASFIRSFLLHISRKWSKQYVH